VLRRIESSVDLILQTLVFVYLRLQLSTQIIVLFEPVLNRAAAASNFSLAFFASATASLYVGPLAQACNSAA
jgi:hypothetical protein